MTYRRQFRSFERSQFLIIGSVIVNVLIFDDMEPRPPPSFNLGSKIVCFPNWKTKTHSPGPIQVYVQTKYSFVFFKHRNYEEKTPKSVDSLYCLPPDTCQAHTWGLVARQPSFNGTAVFRELQKPQQALPGPCGRSPAAWTQRFKWLRPQEDR